MAFNVTDEALEALDAADEQTRNSFIDSLDDNERQTLGDALTGWKQRRGGGIQAQANAFVSEVGQGAQGRTPTSPGFDLDSSPSVAPPGQPAPVAPDASVPAGSFTQGSDFLAHPIDSLGKAIGELGFQGRRLANKAFEANAARFGPGEEAARDTQELLGRSVMSSVLGDKILETQSDEGQLRGINTLEKYLGEGGTTAALVGSQALGNAAQFALPTGVSSEAQKTMTLGTKYLTSALTGAGTGFGMAAFQGGDPEVGAVIGGVLGPAAVAVGQGAQKIAPKIGKVATFTGQKAKEAWARIRELHAPPMVGETAPILATEMAGPAAQHLPVGKVKPSHIQVTQDPNSGEIVAVIHDYSANKPLERKTAQLPLSTPQDVDNLVAYLKKNKVPSLIFDETALNNMSSYDQLRITEPSKKFSPFAPDEPALSLEMGSDEYAKYLKDLENDAKRGSRPTLELRGRTPNPVPEPPNVDAPVEFHPEPDFDMVVEPDGHVVLRPPESPKPFKSKLAPQRGYIKVLDEAGIPTSVTVDRLANDPDVPGNVLVEGTNGNMHSVPASEFHPAGTPSQSMALLESVGAQPVRIPPQPIKLGDIPPQAVEESRILNEDVQTMVRRNPTYGQAIFGKTGLVSNHHMGDRDMAALLLAENAAKDAKALKGEVLSALGKAAGGPKAMNTMLDKDMKQVMNGAMPMADFNAKYPAVAAKVKPLVENMMAQRNANHQELIRLGALPEDALDQGKMEAYLTQAYYRYLFPKKWAGMVEGKTLETAAQAIKKQMQARGEKWTGQQVYTELLNILGAENPHQAFFSSEMGKSKAFDSLRAKQELPSFIKGLLGEVDSGMYSMAETLSRQEALLAKFRLYHEIAGNPAYYSHGPQPHLDARQVPPLPRQFGPLAGGYVAPEIYDNIIDLPKVEAHAANFMNKLTSFRKGNQMFSVRAHLRNNIAAWQSNVLAGGLDWSRPIESGKAMRDAAKALYSYMKDPTGKTGMGNIVKEMRAVGADWSGHAEVEVGKDSPYIREMLKKIAKDNGADAFDITEKLIHGTWGKYKSAVSKNGGMLDLQDRFYRVANYIGLKKKFLANPGKYLPGVAPQDVEKEAAKFAARRINDSFMNAAHVGKNVDALRRSNVGMLAPYGTAMAEEARILGLIPARMGLVPNSQGKFKADDPDLFWRLMGWGVFGAAGVGALKYGLGGTPPEAYMSAKGNMTDMSKARRPGLFPIPLSGMGGDNDPVRMFDASQYFLPGQLLAGHPNDGIAQRVFANALLYPASGGAAEAPERKLLEAFGIVKPIDYDPRLMQSEIGLLKGADALMRAGGVPAFIPQTMDAVNKTQYNGRWGVKWNPVDAAAKMAFTGYSGPVAPISPAGVKEDKGTRRDLHGELKVIARQFAGGKITKEEAEQKMRVVIDAIKASGAKTAERGNLMKSYIDSYSRGKK